MDLDEMMEKLGAAYMAFHDQITDIVKDLSDKEMVELADQCEEEGQPNDSHNFAMPIYTEMSQMILGELGYRIAFRRAEEHQKKTGSGFYCVHCDGDCTPEHLAQITDK